MGISIMKQDGTPKGAWIAVLVTVVWLAVHVIALVWERGAANLALVDAAYTAGSLSFVGMYFLKQYREVGFDRDENEADFYPGRGSALGRHVCDDTDSKPHDRTEPNRDEERPGIQHGALPGGGVYPHTPRGKDNGRAFGGGKRIMGKVAAVLVCCLVLAGCSTASWIIDPPPRITDLYYTEEDVLEVLNELDGKVPTDPEAVLYDEIDGRYTLKPETYRNAVTDGVIKRIRDGKIEEFARNYTGYRLVDAVKRDLGTAGITVILLLVVFAAILL